MAWPCACGRGTAEAVPDGGFHEQEWLFGFIETEMSQALPAASNELNSAAASDLPGRPDTYGKYLDELTKANLSYSCLDADETRPEMILAGIDG